MRIFWYYSMPKRQVMYPPMAAAAIMSSSLALGLATLFLPVLALYASTHREEDRDKDGIAIAHDTSCHESM